MDAVLTLLCEKEEKDEVGVFVPTKQIPREVFCEVHSITRQEFFDAGRNGLNPSLMFTVAKVDYHGEKTIIYEGNGYGVYRTYATDDDYIELYAERKGGTNGKTV